MKISKRLKLRRYFLAPLLSLFLAVIFAPAAHAEWNYGIGTGLFMQNIEADQGFNTVIAGPVQFEVDLDPETISDLTESAFGFGGYATDGTWMIQYSFVNIELEGTDNRTVPFIGTVSTTIGFEVTGGELTAAYPVYRSPSLVLGVLGVGRYRSAAAIALGLAFFCFSGFHYALEVYDTGPNHISRFARQDQVYHIFGRVSDWPELKTNRTEVKVSLDSIISDRTYQVNGAIMLRVRDTTTALQRSDRVELFGRKER